MYHSTTLLTTALAAISAATASDVPDVTDFTGDVGTFAVTTTSDSDGASDISLSIANDKLSAQTDCTWAYNPTGPNPSITIGTKNPVVLYETSCNDDGFLVYWGNSSQSVQINYNTTLTTRPVTITAFGGFTLPATPSADISIDSVALLDESGADVPAGQYGYWDVTYRNFTSVVDVGYVTEDFTFQYSVGGGYVSCLKTVTGEEEEPRRWCTEDGVGYETVSVPERSLSVNSTVEIEGTNVTVAGEAPVRGVCYMQPGGLVCVDRLRVQAEKAVA